MAPFQRYVMRFQTLTHHAEQSARACAIMLGFAIPVSVALDNLLLAVTLGLWLVAADYRVRFAAIGSNGVALAALALFALLAAGLAWGERESGAGMNMLGKYIDLAFVPIFATLFRTEEARRSAWNAFAAALALTLVLSYLTWGGILAGDGTLVGFPDVPGNDLAMFKKSLTQNVLMAFGAFLFAHRALHAESLRSRLLWSALGLLAAINVLLLVQGRTGQLIFMALAVYFAHSVWRWRGTLVAAIGVTLVAVLLAAGSASFHRLTQTFDDLRIWQPGQSTHTSTGERLEFYRNSVAIVRDHPLIGVGTGGFAKAYADRLAGSEVPPTANPHSEYLNIAVQLGGVGLLALLYLFFCEWRLAPALAAPDRHLARALVITIAFGCLFNSLLMDHTEGLFFAWASGLLYAGLQSRLANSGLPTR